MYGTMPKGFLNPMSTPLTYMRLMGCQHTNATVAGYAGWSTTQGHAAGLRANGGSYGMFVFPSSSNVQLGTGSLAAVFYVDSGSQVCLSGAMLGQTAGAGGNVGADNQGRAFGGCKVIGSDANGVFTALVTSSGGGSEKISFNFNDNSELFIRKRFNTNPQLGNVNAKNFYPTASAKDYWLGETFEQELRDGINSGLTGGGTDVTATDLQAVILPHGSGSARSAPSKMTGISFNEAVAGWFYRSGSG